MEQGLKTGESEDKAWSFAAGVGVVALPSVLLGAGLCGWRWGWHSGLGLLAGGLLGGLCLLAISALAAVSPRLARDRSSRKRPLGSRLAAFMCLKTLLIVGFLGASVYVLRLRAAELAAGYTITLAALGMAGVAATRGTRKTGDAR